MNHALDQELLYNSYNFTPSISMAGVALLQPSCSILSPAAPRADRRHTGSRALAPATAPRPALT
jgi:hypothetical protein